MDDALAELIGLILDGIVETGVPAMAPSVARTPCVNERYAATTTVRLSGTVVTADRQLSARFTATLLAGDIVVVSVISAAHRKALVVIEGDVAASATNASGVQQEAQHALLADFDALTGQFELLAPSASYVAPSVKPMSKE